MLLICSECRIARFLHFFNTFYILSFSLTECIEIVGFGNTGVVCLSVFVCLSVCLRVCVEP